MQKNPGSETLSSSVVGELRSLLKFPAHFLQWALNLLHVQFPCSVISVILVFLFIYTGYRDLLAFYAYCFLSLIFVGDAKIQGNCSSLPLQSNILSMARQLF